MFVLRSGNVKGNKLEETNSKTKIDSSEREAILRESLTKNKICLPRRGYQPLRATIETSRLILRPFESGDVGAAFTWFGNPIVMRFTPTGPDTSIEQTKARLAKYQEHQTAHGFSKWSILYRRLGLPIGDSRLLKLH